jgi:hypothetical protein
MRAVVVNIAEVASQLALELNKRSVLQQVYFSGQAYLDSFSFFFAMAHAWHLDY